MVRQLFHNCIYSVQNAGISQEERLAFRAKLDTRGASFVSDPEDSRVYLIFVFPPENRTQIEYDPAWYQGKCRQQASWDFDDLCFHLGRTIGDKSRKMPYVLDAAWVDDVLEQGVVLNKQRWGLHEIVVKRSTPPPVSALVSSHVIVDLMTPMSMLNAPNESTFAHQQTLTLPESIVTTSASSSQVVEQGSKLFANLTKSFYVHTKTQVALKGAITTHGGIIHAIDKADYILVDGTRPFPTLIAGQVAVSVTWLEQSLGLGVVQDIEGYTLGPNQDVRNEPVLEQSVKAELDPPPATLEEASGGNTPVQNTTRSGHSQRMVNQIVKELDQWLKAGCKGSRTAFLKGINKTKPGHDRLSFFKRNRREILAALRDLGHDTSEGSKVYGNPQKSIQVRAKPARSKRQPRASSRVSPSATTATTAAATNSSINSGSPSPLPLPNGGLDEPYENVLPDEWFLHPAWDP